MKKLLGILAINLILCNTSIAGTYYGKGELKMEDWAVKYFTKYIRGKLHKAPGDFVIAKDSSYALYSYCSVGPGNCVDMGMLKKLIKMCERETSTECYQFARGRTIKWVNGINKGNKKSRINSKWSDSEIRAKLTELGFLGGTTSTTTKIEKKKETKTKVSSSGITEELKECTKLYKAGDLTKNQFENCKEKILSQ